MLPAGFGQNPIVGSQFPWRLVYHARTAGINTTRKGAIVRDLIMSPQAWHGARA